MRRTVVVPCECEVWHLDFFIEIFTRTTREINIKMLRYHIYTASRRHSDEQRSQRCDNAVTSKHTHDSIYEYVGHHYVESNISLNKVRVIRDSLNVRIFS